MEKVNVKIKKLNENAVIPFYAHPGEDAGLDIIATSYEYKKDIDAHVLWLWFSILNSLKDII